MGTMVSYVLIMRNPGLSDYKETFPYSMGLFHPYGKEF